VTQRTPGTGRTPLTPPQRAALRHVDAAARARETGARARLSSLLRAAGCAEAQLDVALDGVRRHARVVVHFHPDRVGVRSIRVVDALLEDGEYRSQFETGLSSGSRTAFPGGARDGWERALFGDAYHAPGASLADRPKYGALELIRFPDGPWPRFGSCYLVLRPEASSRASFTFSGSEQGDAVERLGTIDRIGSVMAALLAEVAGGEGSRAPWPPFVAPTLGVPGLTVRGLLERLARDLALPRPSPPAGAPGRVLDSASISRG
jgi:hypothetical protein